MTYKGAVLAVVAVIIAYGACAQAQGQYNQLAKAIATARGGGQRLLVTSGSLTSGAEMDDKYTQNGEDVSPSLAWSRGPFGTRSFAVIAERVGENGGAPVAHWLVYDIPSTQLNLDTGLPPETNLEGGIHQGKNSAGKPGYAGPKPPKGMSRQYHFEVFALNTRLDLDPANADRDSIVKAMKGHVLANGDIVAEYTGK